MALTKRDGQNYGDCQEDIQEYLLGYSTANIYVAEHYVNAVCLCGNRTFRLSIDDAEGVAIRACPECGNSHPIGDSGDFLEDAELEACECLCGLSLFEITVGVSLYAGTENVKWFYVGCRCTQCGLTGCYGDWKNEFEDYRKLLEQV